MEIFEKKLSEMGFSKEEINYYRKLTDAGKCSSMERLRMIMKKRKEILDEIHRLEAQITDMDVMRHEIRKNS